MKTKIARRVQERPGIHLRRLERDLNCSNSTIDYHLKDLQIRERKLHGYRRFYPQKVEESMEKPLAALNHEKRGQILYHIKGGCGFSEIVDKVDGSKATVSEHLKILEEDSLIQRKKKGRSSHFILNDKSLTAVKKYASKLLETSSDNFVEMWE